MKKIKAWVEVSATFSMPVEMKCADALSAKEITRLLKYHAKLELKLPGRLPKAKFRSVSIDQIDYI